MLVSEEMNVTSHNFDATEKLISDLLPTCSFYSIDEEMTGISIGGEKSSFMDFPEVLLKFVLIAILVLLIAFAV